MNVKRKVIALLTLVIMLFSMVGCSKEGLALMEETNRVNAWETTSLTANMSFSAEAEQMKIDATLDMTGWINAQTLQGELEMNLKEIKMNGEALESIKISPIKVFVDKQVAYISKTYFTDLFTALNVPVPEKFNALQADYIGIQTAGTEDLLQVDPKKANDLLMKLMEKAKLDIAIKQDKKNFTIEMNSDQLVDATVAILNAAMDDIDAINALAPTGITQEQVDKDKETVQAMLMVGKNQIKPMISGSNLKVTYNFEDDKYTSGVDMNLQVAMGEDKIAGKMKVEGTSTKIAKKEFVLPTSVVKLTMEEYMDLMGATPVSIAKADAISENQVNYLPFKATMSQFGFEVAYDKATQKTYAVIAGQKIEAKTLIKAGVAYISVEELQNLGFTVEETAEGFNIFF